MTNSPKPIDFRTQRGRGIIYIGVSGLAAVGIWLTIAELAPAVPGMGTLAARMVLTLKCVGLAVLFCLVTGVEVVAHERLSSPAFDPLSGFQTPRLHVNQRYLQNTVEQAIVFAAALFGLAAYSPNGSAMRAVVATTVVWILARFAFWIGYHRSAAMRGLGAPGMAMSMLVLLYVEVRFGYELAGVAGAVAPMALFLGIEAVLFWATARGTPDRPH
jgi:MAPEG family protein